MARQRSPNREAAKQMWLDSGGKMLLKDIATALGVGETLVRKWKSQDKWAAELKGNVTKRSALVQVLSRSNHKFEHLYATWIPGIT